LDTERERYTEPRFCCVVELLVSIEVDELRADLLVVDDDEDDDSRALRLFLSMGNLVKIWRRESCAVAGFFVVDSWKVGKRTMVAGSSSVMFVVKYAAIGGDPG